MNQKRNVYADPQLLKGKPLSMVYYIKEMNPHWVIISEAPQSKNIDTYDIIPEDIALKNFPELNQLFKLCIQENTMFRKGSESGKWYDFH